MSGVLTGIRVIEVANVIAGPFAGMLLADMGAEVIKVEPPGTGDLFRTAGGRGLYSPQFVAYNRGKRSVTINLRTPEGIELLQRLVATADVLLENLRPGVADRLGFGYQALRERNPRLVYCSVTGFGDSGPYVAQPAFDGVIQGLSGLMSQLTSIDAPQPTGPAFADHLAGLFACNGILGALVERARTGEGQYLSVPMLTSTLAFLTSSITRYFMLGEVDGPTSPPCQAQTYAFRCADGKALVVHLSTPPKYWSGLLEVVERPELAEDPRFVDVNSRRAHYTELAAILQAAFEQQPRDTWLERLEQQGVPAGPLNTLPEALDDPQVQHLGGAVEMDWPAGAERIGKLRAVPHPVRYSRTPNPTPAAPPVLGADTDAVFSELGLAAEEIATLRSSGTI